MPDIHHNFFVQAEPERVFEAFATPSGLDAWWTKMSAGEPKLNGLYVFYFAPEYDWRGEVVHLKPGLELTWRMIQAMNDWKDTLVGFRLEARDGGTAVAFFHNGWADASEHFGITSYCWAMLLHGLKQYVEEGIIVPHELRN